MRLSRDYRSSANSPWTV